jgi:hypothetical protein
VVGDAALGMEPWPHDLITKARRFLARGYRYAEAPPEALVDTEHDDSVTRAELEAMDEATIAKTLARPAAVGLAIGFRGPW